MKKKWSRDSNYDHYNYNYIPSPASSDESQFNSFVGGISAQGGGDGPEDVMGGLQVALNKLTWRSKSSRVSVATVQVHSYHCLSCTDAWAFCNFVVI